MPKPSDQPLDILQAEIAALRLANAALEQRMLAEAQQSDAMLNEVELQRNALRAAHKTQQHLGDFIQRVMDSAGCLLIVLAPDGRVRMSNQRCEAALGVPAAALSGRVLDDWLVPAERSGLAAQLPLLPWPVHSALFECVNRQGSYSAEHLLRTPQGRYHTYLLEAATLHSPQGKHEGAVISAIDISQIKQQEARLRRSETLLKEAQQYAHMGSWELDLTRKKLTWSDEAYRIFELDPGQESDPYDDFFAAIHPDDRRLVDRAFADSLRGHMAFDMVHRLLVKGQQVKWVHQRGSNRYGDKGRPLRSVGTVQDITNRYLSEQQLRVAAAAFESQEGMIIADASNVILRVNRAFSEITGYSAEEVVGQTPRLLRSGLHEPAFYTDMWQSIQSTGAWHGEIWNRLKDGQIRPHWITTSAVRDEHNVVTHYVGTYIDITERKQMEEQVRQLAFYDPLTKLPNRRLLNDRLVQAMGSGKRKVVYGALMIIDLDNFKSLNDTHGHLTGDLLLLEAARRLTSCLRETDTVARFGGDEFVVLLNDLHTDQIHSTAQAAAIAEKIRASLAEPYQLTLSHDARHDTTITHHCSASIGVVAFFGNQASQQDVLKWADAAMYQAKAAGRNAIRFYLAPDPNDQADLPAA